MTPPLDDTGTQLLARPTGRDASIEALMALHDRDARSALRRVLGRSQDEDDLVQEVFTRLVVRLRQPGDVVVGAWVRGVAHNLAVDEIRRRRPVPVEETHLDGEVACPADDSLAAADLYSRLMEGAQRLPERQRAALAASLSGEGPGVDRVASTLGVSVHAAESLLSRARFNLRNHLADDGRSDNDGGSLRVSLGTTLAVLAAVGGWLIRRWRAVAVATMATGALTSIAWVPLLQNAPAAVVAQSAGAVAGGGTAGSSVADTATDAPAEDGRAGDLDGDRASASGTGSADRAATAAAAAPSPSDTAGPVRLPDVGSGGVPAPPCTTPAAPVPAPEPPTGGGDVISPPADPALSPAGATPSTGGACSALSPTPAP